LLPLKGIKPEDEIKSFSCNGKEELILLTPIPSEKEYRVQHD